ncbi:MAG TPA: ATP-binding cassette domain-containing protein [Acidimicrobiales bacterium]|nr:ATP-binding cassette domain-containing protein [Acidimicrobiales bacterium]
MTLSPDVFVIGLVTGLTYAILAVGLVLIYRSTRVINFAHGQLGAASALLLAKLVNDHGVSWWLAFPLALVLAAGVGAAAEALVIRRLETAARTTVMIATIGLAQILFAVSFWSVVRPDTNRLAQVGYPVPIDWSFEVADYVVRGADLMIVLVVPAAAALVALLLRATTIGIQIRAVAANREAAELAALPVRRVTMSVWAIAGVLSAVTAILLGPLRGANLTEVLGPSLMVRALAAALVGGMTNLPVAFAAGIGLGVVEQLTFANFASGGVTELAVFALVMVMLVRQAGALSRVRRRADDDIGLIRPPRTLADELATRPWAGWLRRGPVAAAALAAVLLPLLPGLDTQSKAFLLTEVVIYCLIGVSLVVVTGISGQLSMGQFALLGLGAYLTVRLAPSDLSLPVLMAIVGGACALAAAAIGVPAVRVRGLFLGVTTLSFAVLAYGYLFNQRWLTNAGSSFVTLQGTARLPFVGDVTTNRGLYYTAVGTLALALAALAALRASGAARRLMAVRDNPLNAAAHGVPPAATNIVAFALSGFVAGVAGVLWAHSHVNFDANAFPAATSLTVLSAAVIGGVASPAGVILATIAVIGVPIVFEWSTVLVYLFTGAGVLAVVLALPGGIVAALVRARDVLAQAIDRNVRAAVLAEADAPGAPALECRGVTVRFGGIAALDGVSLRVEPGETVALIGSNGAGKTTLMDCVSGYLAPDAGEVLAFGAPVGALSPEYRPYTGVARTFQDARLYQGMTVLQCVLVALESRMSSGLLSSLLAAPWERWAERERVADAETLLRRVGLWEARDVLLADLSTGARRVCDVACAAALRPRLLLLDEPTAGVSHQEVPALLDLVRSVRSELDCAVLLIEHDMAVVMRQADRIYVLEAGSVIAEGVPAAIADHPAVIEAYLGRGAADHAPARRRRRAQVQARPRAGGTR